MIVRNSLHHGQPIVFTDGSFDLTCFIIHRMIRISLTSEHLFNVITIKVINVRPSISLYLDAQYYHYTRENPFAMQFDIL